jgi:hypothetical protein
MTQDEVLDLLSILRGWWPHSDIDQGDPVATARLWLARLASYACEDVERVVKRLSDAGREHAPTVGVVVNALELDRQGDPPSFDELQAWLSRHVRLLPYGEANTPADTTRAVQRLAAAGAHEALLRFVAAHGVYAVRMMPDASVEALDPGRSADRRDMARDYRARVVADWRADPRPGRAVERARRAELASGERPLRRVDGAGVLPAGEPSE